MGFLHKLFGKKPPTDDVSYQEILKGVVEVEKALYEKYKSHHIEHYIAILAAGVRFHSQDKDISSMVLYALSKAEEEIANPVFSAPLAEKVSRYKDMTRYAIRMLSEYRKKTNITEQSLYKGIAIYCVYAGRRLRNITEAAELRSPAKAIYERVMEKYRLSEPEEYLVVLTVEELLTRRDPMQALDALYERLFKFKDETGILLVEFASENYPYLFVALLQLYQRAMRRKELSLKKVMLFLGGRERMLEKRVMEKK